MALADWARIERVGDNGWAEIGARRIYILPTRYGLIYATLLFLMLLGAVNYGNNPAHLLTFLLAGLGSNGMYLTWRNLRGLEIQCAGAAPIFAGQSADFRVTLLSDGRERPAIQLAFADEPPSLVDIAADSRQAVGLTINDLPRGLHRPGRLTLSTPYPLGLFRAWCYVDVDTEILVYPKAGRSWLPPGEVHGNRDGGMSGDGNDDFAGLRRYQAGDPPAQIDWKSFARERGLNTRLFSDGASEPVWLNWSDAPGGDDEARLCSLTRAVLDAEAAGRHYGLQTPRRTLAPGLGSTHRLACLRLLALYGTADA